MVVGECFMFVLAIGIPLFFGVFVGFFAILFLLLFNLSLLLVVFKFQLLAFLFKAFFESVNVRLSFSKTRLSLLFLHLFRPTAFFLCYALTFFGGLRYGITASTATPFCLSRDVIASTGVKDIATNIGGVQFLCIITNRVKHTIKFVRCQGNRFPARNFNCKFALFILSV